MPLRVAEKEGFLHAVDMCDQCPFTRETGTAMKPERTCTLAKKVLHIMTYGGCIPVWCPLPEPTVNYRPMKESK